ncbi:MAG: hypothetical protein KF916_06325 [Microbacteriaceae bacterium]|nr:hypothetical protein [Microbacteriaceae bacterium]
MDSFENSNEPGALPEGLQVGQSLHTVQFSLCVNGVVRIFDDRMADSAKGSRNNSELYLVEKPEHFNARVGRGIVARTAREERRFREAGLLTEDRNSLILPGRLAFDGENTASAGSEVFQIQRIQNPADWDYNEFINFLALVIKSAIERNEYVLLELAGWDAPKVPYTLFAILDGEVRIEASPQPKGSPVWEPHLLPGEIGASMVGPLNDSTPKAVSIFMAHAVSTWPGVQPWDLALTYGQYT